MRSLAYEGALVQRSSTLRFLFWSESCGRLPQAGPLPAVFEFEVNIVSVISVNLTPRNTKPFTMVPEAAFGV